MIDEEMDILESDLVDILEKYYIDYTEGWYPEDVEVIDIQRFSEDAKEHVEKRFGELMFGDFNIESYARNVIEKEYGDYMDYEDFIIDKDSDYGGFKYE